MVCRIIAIILLSCSVAFAADHPVACSGTITAALATAIGDAVDDDTVTIGAGTCTSAGQTITDKQITIQGAGQASTTLTITSFPAFHWVRNSTANGNNRLTAITLTGTGSGTIFKMNGQYGNANANDGWRIDHVTATFANNTEYALNVEGPSWGVMDNCTISMLSGTMINMDGLYCGATCEIDEGSTIATLMGRYISSLALDPGGRAAVYIEDNTLSFTTDSSSHAIFDTNNRGGRLVFRHNTVTNGLMYAHWTRSGWLNGFWFEVYNNKFTHAASDEIFPGRFEGGTGLIYNNTFSDWPLGYIVLNDPRGAQEQSEAPLLYCDGTHNWDGNAGDASAPGWPCIGQIGRASGKTIAEIQAGTKQTSYPFYSWNNGTQDKCYNPSAAGSACINTINFTSWTPNYVKSTPHTVTGGGYGQGDVDFCSGGTSIPAGCGTHTLTYTPYIYPHPLQGADATAPTISGLTPSGTISYQITTQLSATTNENATCRYHASSTTWGDMTQMSSTGFLTHLQTVNVSLGANSFKIVCQDGTANESDAGTWSFTVSAAPATPPAGTFAIGSGGSLTKGSGGSITRQAP